jgi:hypothetical protein
MVQLIRASLKITIFTERDATNGLMVVLMMVIGNSTRCMAGESSLGRMADATRVSIMMIKSKVREFSIGLMDASTMEAG